MVLALEFWGPPFHFPRMLRLILLFLLKNCLWVTRSPKGYQGGIWAPWLVVCKQPTSWLVVCKPPTSWLVVCKQPTSWEKLGVNVLEHCFVMNEAFWRIQKLSSIPSKSEKWDLQFGSGPRASRAQEIIKKKKYFKNTSWNILEHCFVMSEAFWRIQKLSSIPSKSEIWDLQFGSGPRASRAQEIIKKRNTLKILRGTFWDIVLSRMSCLGGFRSSRWYHPDQKNEIYNLGVVPEPPGLKK